MKEMELTPQPRITPGEDGFWEYRQRVIKAKAKRLTDAELAAEYHSQSDQCRHEQVIELLRGEDDYTDLERAAQERMYAELNTLYRFATLPHFDEEEP